MTISPEAAGTGTATFANTIQYLDADGNVWKVTENSNNGANRDTLYRYDQLGRLVEIVDAGGNVTAMRYNRLGWRVALDDPNAGYSTTRYDQNGNINLTTDAAGTLIYRNYDDLSRLTGVHNGNWCTDAVYTYDPAGGIGHIKKTEAYAGCGTLQTSTETTAFDAAGRPTTTVTSVPAAAGVASDALVGPFTTTVAYTRNGVPYQQTYPAVPGSNLPTAETVTTVFNSYGLPISIGGYTELIEYDPYGRPVKTTMGPAGSQGGLITQTAYSATDNRLVRLTATTRAGQLVQDDTYTYDAPGNPTQITHHTGPWGDETECFGYDQRQRLTTAFSITGLTTCPATAPSGAVYADTYAYDHLVRFTNFDGGTRSYNAPTPAGCTSATDPSKPHATTAGTTPAGVTQAFTYNCNGAMLTDSATAGANNITSTYTYDRQQRLTQTVATGSIGGVVVQTATTDNVYDTTNNRIMRQDADGTRTVYLGNTEIRYIPWFGVYTSRTYGQTRREFDGTLTNLAVNHQGSIVAAASTAAIERIQYTPYGAPRTGTSVDDRNFLGRPDDPNTSTVYLDNRHYSPGLGVFDQPDPVVIFGAPATLSPYVYTGGKPLALTDPSGLFARRSEPCYQCDLGNLAHALIQADFMQRFPQYTSEGQFTAIDANGNATTGKLDLASFEYSRDESGTAIGLVRFFEIKPVTSASTADSDVAYYLRVLNGQGSAVGYTALPGGGLIAGDIEAVPAAIVNYDSTITVMQGTLYIHAWVDHDGVLLYEWMDPDGRRVNPRGIIDTIELLRRMLSEARKAMREIRQSNNPGQPQAPTPEHVSPPEFVGPDGLSWRELMVAGTVFAGLALILGGGGGRMLYQ